MAALEESEEPLDLRPVQRRVMNEFCELEVFPGMKREPRFVIWWTYGIGFVDQGSLVFLGAENPRGPFAPRMVLDDYVADLRNPSAGFFQPQGK